MLSRPLATQLPANEPAVGNLKIADRPYFDLPKAAWRTPVLYMLTMSALGLQFYPALLLLFIFWIKAWKNDRYNLAIMLTIFFGGYGITPPEMFPLWASDLATGIAAVLWCIYKKTPLLKKVLVVILIYFAILFFIASCSLESMKIQILGMRHYWGIIYMIIPIAVFAGKDFDIRTYFTRLMPYTLIFLMYYVCDGFILPGNVFLPATSIADPNATTTFYDPYILPLGSTFRKYPPGFYFVILSALPVIRYYRLRWWQWLLFLLALAACRTFSIISGFILLWMLFQGSFRRFVKYSAIAVFSFVAIYFVDGLLPMKYNGISMESTLRIKSTIDQFAELAEAVDDEDIAQFGSGRMAQIIPKLELVLDEHRTLTGLGFLHDTKTTITRYIVHNDYYTDVTQAEEVATAVEVIPMQIFLNTGWVGLISHILFFVVLYLMIRKLRYSAYFLSIIIAMSWFGIGGFVGLIRFEGLFVAGLSFAVVLLENKRASIYARPSEQ